MSPCRGAYGLLAAMGFVWSTGCNAILAYEEGQLASTTSAATGSPGGISTGTGSGGTGGATGTATGSAAAGGAAGAAGGLPAPCELWGAAVCGDGTKCSIIDPATGEAGCVPAGPRPAWSYCEADAQCGDRTWCDHDTGVCKPLCQNSGECPTSALCQIASDGQGGTVLGLMICTSHCNPLDATSCNQSFGPTNCIDSGGGTFDCAATGDTAAFEPCGDATDCAPGLGCYGIHTIWCRPWCDKAHDQCPAPKACLSLSPAVYYDGAEYGMCG